jgi:hypothetical protein
MRGLQVGAAPYNLLPRRSLEIPPAMNMLSSTCGVGPNTGLIGYNDGARGEPRRKRHTFL